MCLVKMWALAESSAAQQVWPITLEGTECSILRCASRYFTWSGTVHLKPPLHLLFFFFSFLFFLLCVPFLLPCGEFLLLLHFTSKTYIYVGDFFVKQSKNVFYFCHLLIIIICFFVHCLDKFWEYLPSCYLCLDLFHLRLSCKLVTYFVILLFLTSCVYVVLSCKWSCFNLSCRWCYRWLMVYNFLFTGNCWLWYWFGSNGEHFSLNRYVALL